MMATKQQLLDVQEEIVLDHNNVRDLYERYQKCDANDVSQRMRIANTFIREVAIHGDAEELSYYRFLAEHGQEGVAEHSKEEHQMVKRLAHDADVTPPGQEFDELLSKAFHAFDQHAKEEEEGILKKMAEKMDSEKKDAEARNFLKARKLAPIRPHPAAPQSGGITQELAGMQAKMQDKAVNAIRGVDYVDLKYEHPQDY